MDQSFRPESPESQTLVDVGEGGEGVVENAPPVTHVIHGEFIDGEYGRLRFMFVSWFVPLHHFKSFEFNLILC